MDETTIDSSIPVLPWMRNPIDVSLLEDCPLDLVPFLDPRLKLALQNMGISSLFPVQVAVWQETVGPGAFERDLCVNSPTGSGKTLAYALPIVQKLSAQPVRCLRALVVLPTRDLALQVKEVFAALVAAVGGLSVGLAVGQSSIEEEISVIIKRPDAEMGLCYDPYDMFRELQSSVDILVATPGRLMDHLTTTMGFTLEHLLFLVVDETDRLLRDAYQSWLPAVLGQVSPPSEENLLPPIAGVPFRPFHSLKTIRRCGVERGFKGKLFPRLMKIISSATVTRDPSKLAQLDLHHPLFLTTGKRRYQLPKELESYKLICESKLKPLYLIALLQSLGGEKCIVFTSSVESTHRLCTLLNFFPDMKIKIKEFSGVRRQSTRSKTLKAFRDGKIQVLVSSDAITRGMDVEGVKNVINYSMPAYVKTYIHRAGRTARAGQVGRCFTLLLHAQGKEFKKILRKAGIDSCPVFSVSPSSIEPLEAAYEQALQKLKEMVDSESAKKHKIGDKYSKGNMTAR